MDDGRHQEVVTGTPWQIRISYEKSPTDLTKIEIESFHGVQLNYYQNPWNDTLTIELIYLTSEYTHSSQFPRYYRLPTGHTVNCPHDFNLRLLQVWIVPMTSIWVWISPGLSGYIVWTRSDVTCDFGLLLTQHVFRRLCISGPSVFLGLVGFRSLLVGSLC